MKSSIVVTPGGTLNTVASAPAAQRKITLPKLPQGAAKLSLVAMLFVSGACICLATGGTVSEAMSQFSWSTLALIIVMELFSGLIAQTRAMEAVAVKIAMISKCKQYALLALLTGSMFLVSSFLNNITALLTLYPCLALLLRTIAPDKRYLNALFASILALSNLGGASSGVGDLPAVLIMSTGVVSFADYTLRAFPVMAFTSVVVVGFWITTLKIRGIKGDTGSQNLAVGLLKEDYKYVKVNLNQLIPLVAILACMVCAWMLVPSSIMGTEIIAILGCVVAYVVSCFTGMNTKQLIDFSSVLTFAGFLFLAASISSTGALEAVASTIAALCPDQKTYIIALLFLASVLSGLLGAGPAAAIVLPIMVSIAQTGVDASWLMTAYGASICAGSSLFLFSATAGLLMSSKIDGSKIKAANGQIFQFDVASYLPYGICNYAIQMTIAIALAVVLL